MTDDYHGGGGSSSATLNIMWLGKLNSDGAQYTLIKCALLHNIWYGCVWQHLIKKALYLQTSKIIVK